MIVRYWNPLQEIETASRQMDEVFNRFSNVEIANSTTWTPAIRLIDAGDGYQLTVLLPGIAPEDVDVQASQEAIAISGSRKMAELADTAKILHDDASYGSFRRVVYLPEAIQHQAIEANFGQGMLTLMLPKQVKPENKVVKIELAPTVAVVEPAKEKAAEPVAIDNTETGDVWAAEAEE
ncbi:heat-shock protein Hsp20 [filamentous cyanobacterium CCP5]|nr:heat-shock protein Hsp20 [filamentous cyanobacterium CCP5]